MKTFGDTSRDWLIVAFVAAIQNGIAVFAVYSSSQDILSDGACMGGVFGTLANLICLGVVLMWAIVLAVISLREKTWHARLAPVLGVALSSTIAILIGVNAALRCTV